MLRRMNSEVSTYSIVSTTTAASTNKTSPILNSFTYGGSTKIEALQAIDSEQGLSRGSIYYLSIGTPPNPKRERGRMIPQNREQEVDKRDSHLVHEERRQRKYREVEAEGDKEYALAPVEENSSPPPASTTSKAREKAIGTAPILRFPTLSILGTNIPTLPNTQTSMLSPNAALPNPTCVPSSTQNKAQTSSQRARSSTAIEKFEKQTQAINSSAPHMDPPESIQNWSDAAQKPITNVVRRESKMEHPSPQRDTPPLQGWGLSSEGKVSIHSPKQITEPLSGLGLGLVAERWMGGKGKVHAGDKAEEWEASSIPESFGLYDQEGFLRSSPDRETVLQKQWERMEMRGR